MTDKPDVSKLREGDVVTVRMVFHHIAPNGCIVGSGSDDHGMRAHPSDVLTVSKALSVGDPVAGYSGIAKIVGIYGKYAWVSANGVPATVPLIDLSPA